MGRGTYWRVWNKGAAWCGLDFRKIFHSSVKKILWSRRQGHGSTGQSGQREQRVDGHSLVLDVGPWSAEGYCGELMGGLSGPPTLRPILCDSWQIKRCKKGHRLVTCLLSRFGVKVGILTRWVGLLMFFYFVSHINLKLLKCVFFFCL